MNSYLTIKSIRYRYRTVFTHATPKQIKKTFSISLNQMNLEINAFLTFRMSIIFAMTSEMLMQNLNALIVLEVNSCMLF